MPARKAFEECYRVGEGDDPCWIWTAGFVIAAAGLRYGKTRHPLTRRVALAHRVSYEMAYGPIPEGLIVHHKCEVTLCVRPTHLVATTQERNVSIAIARGRHPIIKPGMPPWQHIDWERYWRDGTVTDKRSNSCSSN